MTNDDFYALLSEASGASPKQDGPVPGFYDALGSALTIQQQEEMQAMQAATADLFSPDAESIVPMSLQRAGMGLIQGAKGLGSGLERIGAFDLPYPTPLNTREVKDQLGFTSPDDLNREIGATEAGLREEGSFIGNSARGAINSIATIAPGIPFGAPGVIGMAMASSANQALTTGKDAGLEGPALYSYVGTTAAIEGVVTSAFQRFGLGGFESAATKEAVLKGIAQPLKYVAKTIGAELPEEIIIQVGQNVNDYLHSVTPEMDLGEGLVDVIGQTIIAAGAASGARVGQGKLRMYEQGKQDAQGALRGRTEGYQAPTATEAPTEPPAAPVEQSVLGMKPVPGDAERAAARAARIAAGQPGQIQRTGPSAGITNMPVEDSGLIDIGQFTPEEQAALRKAGVVDNGVLGSGVPHYGVAPEDLRRFRATAPLRPATIDEIAEVEQSENIGELPEQPLGNAEELPALIEPEQKAKTASLVDEDADQKIRDARGDLRHKGKAMVGRPEKQEELRGILKRIEGLKTTLERKDPPKEVPRPSPGKPIPGTGWAMREDDGGVALVGDDGETELMGFDSPQEAQQFAENNEFHNGDMHPPEVVRLLDEAIRKSSDGVVSSHLSDPIWQVYDAMGVSRPGGQSATERVGTWSIDVESLLNRVTKREMEGVALAIFKARMEALGLDPDGVLGPNSGLSKEAKDTETAYAKEQAERIFQAIGAAFLTRGDAPAPEASQRQAVLPAPTTPDLPAPVMASLANAKSSSREAFKEALGGQTAYNEHFGRGGKYDNKATREAILAKAKAMAPAPVVETPDVTGTGWTVETNEGVTQLIADDGMTTRNFDTPQEAAQYAKANPFVEEGEGEQPAPIDDRATAPLPEVNDAPAESMAIDIPVGKYIDDYKKKGKGTRGRRKVQAQPEVTEADTDQGIPAKFDPPSAITKPFLGPSQVRSEETVTTKRTPERKKPVAPYRALQTEANKGVKPVSAPEVIAKIQKVLDNVTGTVTKIGGYPFRRAGYAAVYRSRQNALRLGRANDIDRMSHEIAHALEPVLTGEKNPWTEQRVGKDAAQELIELGRSLYGDTVPNAGYGSEGFAEFMYYWITQPSVAREAAPAFHRYFVQNILGNDAKLKTGLEAAQDAAVRWEAQGAMERGSKTVYDPGSAKERVRRAATAINRWRSNWIARWWDAGSPLYAFTQAVEKTLGRKLNDGDNPYKIFEGLNMQSAALVTEMVENGVMDMNGTRVARSLKEATEILEKNKIDSQTFGVYLVYKRGQALYNDPRGERDPGMSKSDADAVVAEIEAKYPEIVRAAEIVYEWNDGILQYWASASDNNALTYEAIKLADPGYYVPLARDYDAYLEAGARSGGQGPRRLKGSSRRVKDPVATMLSEAQRLVSAAHKEKLIESVVALEGVTGMGKFIEKVDTPVRSAAVINGLDAFKTSLRALRKTGPENAAVADGLRKAISDDNVVDALANAAIPIIMPEMQAKNGSPYIVRFEDGKPVWYEVQPGMMEILGSMELSEVDGWLKAFGTLASISRTFTTSANVGFNVITNPQRDIQTMMANTPGDPATTLAYWTQAMAELSVWRMTGQRSESVDAFMRLGGAMMPVLGIDAPHTRRVARKVTGAHKGIIKSAIQGDPKGVFQNIITAPGEAWDAYRDIIGTPEMAPRIAAMRVVADQRGIDLSKPISFDDAIALKNAMKKITTDFTGGGLQTKKWNRYIPFLNASIQGMRASATAAQRNPTRFLIVSGVMQTLPAVLSFLMFKDEEWYKEMDPREWFMYHKLPIMGQLVRVPRPFETGGLFGALAEAGLMALYQKEPDRAVEWAKMFLTSIAPPVLPTALRIPLEQLMGDGGRDLFFDQPIVAPSLQRLPAPEQYNEYTTKAARSIGKTMGLSPARIDHVIRSLFGSVGRDVLTTTGLGPTLTEREMELADIPIVGRQFKRGGPMGGSHRSISKMYDVLSEHRTRQNSIDNPETPQERNARLMLEDAATAVGALSIVIRDTYKTEDREEYAKLRLSIAQDALEKLESGGFGPKYLQATANMWNKRKEAIQDRKEQERRQ